MYLSDKNMKKKFHKILLTLVLVFVPPFLLVFTNEGNRVVDNVMLWLFDRPSLKLNLQEASQSYTEADIQKAFPGLKWQCGSLHSSFGETACNASIGSFNELPARHIVAYFAQKHLSAIQLRYHEHYHDQLIQQLIKTLGQPENAMQAIKSTPDADPVLQWSTGRGLVILKKSINPTDEPVLLWISSVK